MKAPLEASAVREGERIIVRSPGVGVLVGAPGVGAILSPGASIGELVVLGRSRPLRLPDNAAGQVVEVGGDARRLSRPVAFDDVLLVLDINATAGVLADQDDTAAAASGAELVFAAPSSGRFYSRPDPQKPPFVAVGDIIERGQSVCMLEVMKTYSRVRFDGDGVPDKARVVAVRPKDGDDIGEGDVILELESA